MGGALMATIRALLVDDDANNSADVRFRLQRHFNKLGWQVTWEAVKSPEEAEDDLENGHRTHLFVIDLLYPHSAVPDTAEPRGLDTIKMARDKFPDAYIM